MRARMRVVACVTEMLVLAAVWWLVTTEERDRQQLPEVYRMEVALFRRLYAEQAVWYTAFEPLSPEFVRAQATFADALAQGVVSGFVRRAEDPARLKSWLENRLAHLTPDRIEYPLPYCEALGRGRLFYCTYSFRNGTDGLEMGFGVAILRDGRIWTIAGTP